MTPSLARGQPLVITHWGHFMEPLVNQRILAVTDDFWDAFQRVRHRIPMLWAREGNQVLWLEQTPFPNQIRRGVARLSTSLRPMLRDVHPRLSVGTMPPAFPKMLKGGALGNALRAIHRLADKPRLRRYLKRLGWDPDMVVLFQQPVCHDYLDMFPRALKVYYCSDIYGFGRATPGEMEEERVCCEKVDVIFTTSEIVRQRLAPFNEHTYHLPHAVDERWWEENRGHLPGDLDAVPRPRALFSGAVTPRIAFDLVEQVAAARPDWHFVFVGMILKAEQRVEQLRTIPNIHFLGEKKWEEIPGYIAHSDALFLPYAGNAVAQNMGLPLKFYEFAISGLPIICTDYQKLELPDPRMIEIHSGVEEWCAFFDRVRAQEGEDEFAPLRRRLAAENTYAARFARQRDILKDIMKRKAEA